MSTLTHHNHHLTLLFLAVVPRRRKQDKIYLRAPVGLVAVHALNWKKGLSLLFAPEKFFDIRKLFSFFEGPEITAIPVCNVTNRTGIHRIFPWGKI
jgi:hypothetical protein